MNEMKTQEPETTDKGLVKKESAGFLICAFILAILFDLLFYGKPLGVSYPVYMIALYSILFWNLHNHQALKFTWSWLLAIPVLALSFTYFVFSNPIFTVLNFLMIPILFFSHTLLLTSNNRYKWFDFRFLADIFYGMIFRTLANSLKPFSLLSKLSLSRIKSGKFSVISRILLGILISIPLLVIIVPLLASADDVFLHFVKLIPNIFTNIHLGEFVPRLILVIIVVCMVFSYLWSLFVSKTAGFRTASAEENTHRSYAFIDSVTVTTILVLIDALYVFFIAIQFSYLFGSLSYGLPQDFTYAQYARKGFFELVVITLINLAILLANMNFGKTSGLRMNRVIKVLNSTLVIATFIMLLSAHFRMSLYEEAYGFTYLRVLTHAFMGYLFVLYIITLWKIWFQSLHLLKCYIVISLVAYTLLNYMNIDQFIAKNNIERYKNGSRIDILYLSTLSYDAVPPLVEFINSTPDQGLTNQLEKELANKKKPLERATTWQSFNISKYRAMQVLSK